MRKISSSLHMFIAFAFGTAITFAVVTADAIPGDEICEKDIVRLCPGIPRGAGKIGKCLSLNNQTVDLKCRALFEAFRADRIRMKNNCYQDVRKFCTTVLPGKGRVVKCLRDNESRLSTNCKNELPNFKDF